MEETKMGFENLEIGCLSDGIMWHSTKMTYHFPLLQAPRAMVATRKTDGQNKFQTFGRREFNNAVTSYMC